MSTTHTRIESRLGPLTLVATDGALAAVRFDAPGNESDRGGVGPPADVGLDDAVPADAVLAEAGRQLRAYFDGERTSFDLPLAPEGSEFQRRVWTALTEIGYGETWSYGELAAAVGVTAGARAVGMANAKNPLAIVVPCHRVIGANGTLVGYAGGLDRKRFLLDLEAHTLATAAGATATHVARLF